MNTPKSIPDPDLTPDSLTEKSQIIPSPAKDTSQPSLQQHWDAAKARNYALYRAYGYTGTNFPSD